MAKKASTPKAQEAPKQEVGYRILNISNRTQFAHWAICFGKKIVADGFTSRQNAKDYFENEFISNS